MKVAVLAYDDQWWELKEMPGNIGWKRFSGEQNFLSYEEADIYMNLMEDAFTKDYSQIKKPVLINSVINTFKERGANENVLRINGWNGFLPRSNWEVVGKMNKEAEAFLSTLKKTVTIVPDEPGMIAARVISMIINEAYFALEENLSTREEIDMAMKLGTNYPYGPFEWCEKIGIKNIAMLLQKLSINDKRYLPAPLLIKQSMI